MTHLRFQARDGDVAAVRELVATTGFFSEAEIDIAGEVIAEAVAHGDASGHLVVMAEADGVLTGFAAYGPIPATQSSWDLYWIAVTQKLRGAGIGKELLRAVEDQVKARGGTRLYIDTAGRAQYQPTHAFYERAGYTRAAFLPDYYAPGDGRVTFMRVLTP